MAECRAVEICERKVVYYRNALGRRYLCKCNDRLEMAELVGPTLSMQMGCKRHLIQT